MKSRNPNHPPKGSTITVHPITSTKDITRIKQLLSTQPRNLCLFTLGINTNLRASDLIRLTFGQVTHLKPMDILELKEQKTSKLRRINLNANCIASIQNYISSLKTTPQQHQLLFPVTTQHINRLVKSWCKTINLKGNFGSHTLRKTWGYHQRVTFNTGIPELMVCFNHSNQQTTLKYLCIQADEISNTYKNAL